MDLEVSNGWAVPPQHFQVQRFKPQSAVADSEYKLTLYERTIQVRHRPNCHWNQKKTKTKKTRKYFQISDIAAPDYPILLRLAQAAQPEGVSITMVEHLDEHDENRYVPDNDLKELKNQLDEMGGPVKKKK